jgi:hypothetical protein
MAKYSITNGSTSGGGTQQNTTTTYVGALIGLASSTSTPRRIKVYDVLIGTNGTPADNFLEWDISRITASSTSTVLAAQPLDPADATALTVATVNSSTFGTITTGSNVFYVGINQRASYRWVAAPGGELVAPATSSAGFQLRTRSGGYTGTATGTLHFEEQ